MITYRAISVTPSSQFDSPSNTTNATAMTVTATATTSIGANTSVRVVAVRKFDRIEPMIAAWTTATRPACNAKKPMNSSGRLPRALWRTPVAPGPKRSPSCSTLRPTTEASSATAAPATTKARIAGAPA
jgi:hypothetical protein